MNYRNINKTSKTYRNSNLIKITYMKIKRKNYIKINNNFII